MDNVKYKPGDKVLVIDPTGNRNGCFNLGDVLTIKICAGTAGNFYEFFETDQWLPDKCFVPYHPSTDTEKGGCYNGWPNRETDEAALVFFNDAQMLREADEYLVDAMHASVHQSAQLIKRIKINSGLSTQICVHSILKQYAVDRLHDTDISSARYHAIVKDLESQFPQKKPSARARAQAIADHSENRSKITSALTVSANENSNPAPQEIKIMKVETKHFVNGQDINSMSLEEKVQLIKVTEDKIADLEAVKTESKMVTAEIEKLKKFLADVVSLFDKKE